MNKNVKRLLSFMLAFAMVFAVAVPALAAGQSDTQDADAQNYGVKVDATTGDLSFNFTVAPTKTGSPSFPTPTQAYVTNQFVSIDNLETWKAGNDNPIVEFTESGDGHIRANIDVSDVFDFATNEALYTYNLTVYNEQGRAPRYFEILVIKDPTTGDYEIQGILELLQDGSNGENLDEIRFVNLDAKLEEELSKVKGDICFDLRFVYSDPNRAIDEFVTQNNDLSWEVVSVAKGADINNDPVRHYDANGNLLPSGTISGPKATNALVKFCLDPADIEANRDYYVRYYFTHTPGQPIQQRLEDGQFMVFQTTSNYDPEKPKLFDHENKEIDLTLVNGAYPTIQLDVEVTPTVTGGYYVLVTGTGGRPVPNAKFELYEVQNNTEDTRYLVDQYDNLRIKGAPIYEVTTNNDGYAYIDPADVKKQADGTVRITSNITGRSDYDLQPGEVLALKYVDGADKQFKLGDKDTWAVKFFKIESYDVLDAGTNLPMVKGNIKWELLDADDKPIVAHVVFGDSMTTIRVKIFNAGQTAAIRTPITGAQVGIYKVINDQVGTALKVGNKAELIKTTDDTGMVEFKVPRSAVQQFFGTGVIGNVSNVAMPYAIKQLDTGDVEGVAPYPYYITTNGYFADGELQIGGSDGLDIRYSDYGDVINIEIENRGDALFSTFANGRIAGNTKFETAVEVAKLQFADGVPEKFGFKNAVLAEVETLADSLTAGPLAYLVDGPLLAIKGNEIPEAVIEYLEDEDINRVYIVGGEATINYDVRSKLRDMNISIVPIQGQNRFGTAVSAGDQIRKLANDDQNNVAFNTGYPADRTVYLANGYTFADALSVSVPAARYGIPILLTRTDSVPAETIQALKDWKIKKIVIVGGEGSVKEAVEVQLAKEVPGMQVERYFGTDRQFTSMKIAETFFPNSEHVFFANGDEGAFSDALVAAPYAARLGAPILLLNNNGVTDAVAEYIKANKITSGTIVGGTSQVSTETRNELSKLITLEAEYDKIK